MKFTNPQPAAVSEVSLPGNIATNDTPSPSPSKDIPDVEDGSHGDDDSIKGRTKSISDQLSKVSVIS